MITFVEYYEKRKDGTFYNPCGDRSIVILDGRRSLSNLKLDAIECNGHRRPVYDAFQIFKGDNINRNVRALTNIIPL